MGTLFLCLFFFWWIPVCICVAKRHDKIVPYRLEPIKLLRFITYAWFTIPVKTIAGAVTGYVKEEVLPKLPISRVRLLTGAGGARGKDVR